MQPQMRAGARLAAAVPYGVLLAVSAYLYADAGNFGHLARPGELGPDFWPRAILGVMMAVCAAAIVARLLGRGFRPGPNGDRAASGSSQRAVEGDPAASRVSGDARAAAAPPADAHAHAHPYLLAGGIALSAAYVAALDLLGFFVATALYLGIFMSLGRYRRGGVIVATSLIGSLAFVIVFMKIVYVSLPLGQGPFRALSAALLAVLGVR